METLSQIGTNLTMNRLLYRLLVFIALAVFGVSAHAQMAANGGATAQTAVQLILGDGVEVSNVVSTGAPNQVGTFTCNNCGIGFGSGLVLATGNVAVANGPNNSGTSSLGGGASGVSDPDLAQLVNVSLHDAATVTFNFVAMSDSVSFNYVFASEEYPEFANSSFNDVFGFFLSGPGINGPFSNNAINIALIPGTTLPVSINNVNATNNSQYYVPNPNTPNSTQFDAFTVPLVAFYNQLICGETYTIKLAIADGLDTGYDSAVFIEESSFNVPIIDVALEMGDIGFDENTLLEGCGEANLIFTRNTNLGSEQLLELVIGGTAENGVDYTAIPDTVVFPPGVDVVTIPITAFIDDLEEGVESIILTYMAAGMCGSSQEATEQTLEIFIIDVAPLEIEIDSPLINCNETALLEPSISGGYGVYAIEWEDFANDFSVEASPSVTTTYFFTVSDTCGLAPVNASVTVEIPVLPDVEALTSDAIGIDCLTSLETTGDATGGNGLYSFQWFDPDGNLISEEPYVAFEPETPGELTLVVTDGCGETGQALQPFFFNEVPITLSLPDNLSSFCLDDITVSPSLLSGGIGDLSLSWSVDGTNQGTGNAITTQINGETTIAVVATDECGNTAAAQTVVEVLPSPITLSLPSNPMAPCVADFELTVQSLTGGVGDYTYSWTVDGLPAGSNPTVTVNSNSTMDVSLSVTDGCQNSASASTTVQITPVAIAVDLGEDFVAPCMSDVFVAATVTGGVGPFNFQWVLNALDNPETSDQIEFIAMGNIMVEVEVNDVCANTAYDQIMVSIPPNPPSVITSADTLICKGQSATLWAEVVNQVGNMTYRWLPGMQTTPSITVSPQQSTVYTVSVTDICNRTTLKTVNVTVEEVVANFDFSYVGSWGIQTYNTSWPSNSNFIWDFGDGNTSTEHSPRYEFVTNSTQNVTLFAESPNGCIHSQSAIFDPMMDVFVPSAFTPNGDGVNDVFMAKGHSIREFQMWIYNRWGVLVFYSEDINQPWLGEVRDGQHFAQNESYNWVIKAVGIRNNSFERSGTVTVIR